MKLTDKQVDLLRKLDAHKVDGYIPSTKDARALTALVKNGLAELKLYVNEDVCVYFITSTGVNYVKRLPNNKS